jgi:hypothetical protein
MDVHADGLLAPLDEPPDEFRDAFSLVPEFLRTTDEGELNLSEYGPRSAAASAR